MKKDVNNHEQRYKNWKEEVTQSGVEGLTKANSDILMRYVFDMEIGTNISVKNKKGARSYPRLNNIRQRIRQIMIIFQDKGVNDITNITETQVVQLFSDMNKGIYKTKKGETYRSAGDYARCFTAFWHWWQKVNRKQGILLPDICEEVDKSSPEGKFVYLTKEQLDEMLPYFNEEEQLILLFTFDSLIRAPTELSSLQVKDVFKQGNSTWINLPKEITKTGVGRNFNLLYSSDALWKYISKKNLTSEDYIFSFNPPVFNKSIQKVAVQLFGDKISHPIAGGKFSELSLYDLRHCGAIHLRILASKNPKISLDSIRQRAGWVDFSMLNYYTKFIGLDGSIDKNELVIEEDKNKFEEEIFKMKQDNSLMAKRFDMLLELFKKHPEEMGVIFKTEKQEFSKLFTT